MNVFVQCPHCGHGQGVPDPTAFTCKDCRAVIVVVKGDGA